MDKVNALYEGKAKKIFPAAEADRYIVYYKDDATAFDGKKKGTIHDKGVMNNLISAALFTMLEEEGVKTHFVKVLSDREQLVRKVTILPLEVIIRNTAAGSLCKRLGLPEGQALTPPVLEFCYKNDDLGDPFINEDLIQAMKLATPAQVETVKASARKVNDLLTAYFDKKNIHLVDFKLEYGVTPEGEVILADEISPDTCRFWDKTTGEKLDKDRFRRDLGDVEKAYEEMLRRVKG